MSAGARGRSRVRCARELTGQGTKINLARVEWTRTKTTRAIASVSTVSLPQPSSSPTHSASEEPLATRVVPTHRGNAYTYRAQTPGHALTPPLPRRVLLLLVILVLGRCIAQQAHKLAQGTRGSNERPPPFPLQRNLDSGHHPAARTARPPRRRAHPRRVPRVPFARHDAGRRRSTEGRRRRTHVEPAQAHRRVPPSRVIVSGQAQVDPHAAASEPAQGTCTRKG